MAKKAKKLEKLCLDLGTGNGARKPAGYLGVDIVSNKEVDIVLDLREMWPWEDNSVDEVQSIGLVQQLTATERIHFVNELCRVLKQGSKATIFIPNWSSAGAYGNLLNLWPPVAEAWFPYLNKGWRDVNDINGIAYTCDFDFTLGYLMNPQISVRSQEYQQHALTFWKEAATDICCTLIKR